MKFVKKQIWQLLKEKVYYEDGSLRDIYMLNTTAADWEKWVEFVNQNYRVEWYDSKSNITKPNIDFASIESYWRDERATTTAKIFLDTIQINAHFFDDSEIENDLDPREFKNIKQHYKLLSYLNSFSNLCNKPIVVTPENDPSISLMTIYKNTMDVK